jgi:hypothetical protein
VVAGALCEGGRVTLFLTNRYTSYNPYLSRLDQIDCVFC